MPPCVLCWNRVDNSGSVTCFCKQCLEKVLKTIENRRRQIENLEAKVAFLRFMSPINRKFPNSNISESGPGYTDVVLIAGSEDEEDPIPAHKAVLVSRSPVFKAMLENDVGKRRSGTIKISNVSHKVLCAFVHYLYTAEAEIGEQMARELLEMAEKYQVIKHLKAYCEEFLVSRLNWDNSIMSYVLAHQQNSTHLLDAALSLITDNMGQIIHHQEYNELLEKDPRLMVKIYEAYLSKQLKAPPSAAPP